MASQDDPQQARFLCVLEFIHRPDLAVMNSDLQNLIDLQEVDLRIAALKTEVAALPKHVAEIEAKLAGAKKNVETAQAAMKADESARRKY